MPDFLMQHPGPGNGLEVDYDHHLRRDHGSLRTLYNSLRRPIELQLIEREAERLGRLLDVLDVGCGDPSRSASSYHRRLLPLTRSYIGIEPSLSIVSRVRPHPGVGMVRAAGESRIVRDDVVDVALCFGALDRCVDPDRVLANMRAALRPGGCGVIDLVNEAVWYRPVSKGLRGILSRRPSDESRRRWRMSPDDLKRRLEAAGFRDVELHDLLYLAKLLESHALDGGVRLLGEARCMAAFRQIDRLGRFIAPGRGGMFIALARKPETMTG